MKIGRKVLSRITRSPAEAIGGVGGVGVGGYLGSSMGIAAFGGAIPATAPFALVGGIIGLLGVMAYRNRSASSQTDLMAGSEDK